MACRSQSGQEYVSLHLSKNRRYAETEIPEREKLSGIFFFYKNIFRFCHCRLVRAHDMKGFSYWMKARISPLATKSPCLQHTATIFPSHAGFTSSIP